MIPPEPERFEELCRDIGLAVLLSQKVQFTLAYHFCIYKALRAGWDESTFKVWRQKNLPTMRWCRPKKPGGTAKRWGKKDGSVVISQLGNENRVFRNFIDKSVFVCYSPGPVARKGVF